MAAATEQAAGRREVRREGRYDGGQSPDILSYDGARGEAYFGALTIKQLVKQSVAGQPKCSTCSINGDTHLFIYRGTAFWTRDITFEYMFEGTRLVKFDAWKQMKR